MSAAQREFEELYARYAASAFRRARRLLGNDADADEVVHDVFVSLLQQPEQYAGKSSMSTFLYSAVTHASLNRIRNRATRERLLIARSAELAGEAGAPLEQRVLLQTVLQRLPEQLAQVVIYYYVDELTLEDIARIMRCSRRQVRNALDRLADYGVEQELAACQ